ncbi:MAG: hypothetical protein QM783_06800 [Phycisphaerales bacterium]
MVAPTPAQATSRRTECIHCGYNLSDTAPDSKCPECGNLATDTREGTLFYRLPPTRLGTITTGAALVCVMNSAWLAFALLELVRWFIPGGISNGLLPLWDAVRHATGVLFAPWVALFVLAAPLNRFPEWKSAIRISALVLTGGFVLFQTVLAQQMRTSTWAGPGASTMQIVSYIADSVFGYVPALLSSIQLHKIARRLPGTPFASLGAAAIICSSVLLARAGIESSSILSTYLLPQTGLACLAVLLWIPPTALSFLVYRELRAVGRDVDTDHPYTRT